VIGEAMVALTLADAFLEKFGGDSIPEIERNLTGVPGIDRPLKHRHL